MNLDAQQIKILKDEQGMKVRLNGETLPVDKVALAFPQSDPDRYVGLLDADGHEIGLIENPDKLDKESQDLLDRALREIYFVPTILEIRSVTSRGTSSQWEVVTDDGDRSFKIPDRDALNGSEAPALTITDESGKRYLIPDYWTMAREDREAIRDLLPDKVVRSRARRGARIR
ncbi:MAG TPA: hypothetical protein DIU35_03280 [Candidatus Latescibacteria bacterium]|nr:hypothetical protein [Candidatus Latescibacterota bacterium]